MKDPREILSKIIAEEGSCNWAGPETCLVCPMSKLKSRGDGNFLGCIEAIGIEGLTNEEANVKYKTAAEKLLVDLEWDSILEQDAD